jgi:hypothetical protein
MHNHQAPLPCPLLHWCHYGASGPVSGAKTSKTMCSLSAAAAKTATPFQLPFIILDG